MSTAPIWTRQRRRSGVGILMVITIIAILTVLVSEIIYTAQVRLLTANHQAERTKAYWLSKSGMNIYVLILAANKELGKNSFIQQLGLGDSLWQMVPSINTGLMRMLFQGSTGLSDEDVEEENGEHEEPQVNQGHQPEIVKWISRIIPQEQEAKMIEQISVYIFRVNSHCLRNPKKTCDGDEKCRDWIGTQAVPEFDSWQPVG